MIVQFQYQLIVIFRTDYFSFDCTASTPGQIEDLFGKRGNFRRSSARATIGHSGERRINITPIRPPQIRLKAQMFEVPHNEGKALFVGREWLFKDIEMVCCANWVIKMCMNGSEA